MIRRAFIDRLLSLLSGFLFFPVKGYSQKKNYMLISKNGRETEIPFIIKHDQIFISLVDFAQGADYGYYTNEEKRKTVLYILAEFVSLYLYL